MPIIDVYGEQLEFPDTMGEADIQNAIENEYLPTLDPNSQAGRSYRKDLVEQQREAVLESQRLTREQAPGAGEAALRGFAQGTTFGLGEEIGAAVSAPAALFDPDETISERYKRLRDEQRAENRLARTDSPASYIGGQIGGGLASGVAGAGRLVAGMGLRQALPRLTGIGAGEGAVAGYGLSEDPTLAGQAGDVATGAITGAALAPAAAALGAGAGRVVRSAAQRLRPETRAANRVMADLRADNLTVQEAQERLAANPNLILGDLGENLQQRLGAIANQPGATAQRARELLETRNIEQLDRLMPVFNRAFGTTGVLDAAEESVAQARRVAGPLYDEAHSMTVRLSPSLRRELSKPAAKSATRSAEMLARNEGADFAPVDLKAEGGGEISVRTVDYLKRALQDQESTFLRAGKLNKARIYGDIRRGIVKQVDDSLEAQGTTAWKDARQIAATDFENRNALDMGNKIFTEKTPNIRRIYDDMSGTEKDHFRIGVFEKLIDRLGTKVETANLVQDFRKPKIKEAMRVAFDDPRLFREFENVIGDERRMFETMRKALQGSPTASRQAFAAEPDIGALAGEAAFGPAGAMTQQAGRRLLGGLGQRATQAPQRMAAEGGLLLGRSPEQQLQQLVPPMSPPTVGNLLPPTSTPTAQQTIQQLIQPDDGMLPRL